MADSRGPPETPPRAVRRDVSVVDGGKDGATSRGSVSGSTTRAPSAASTAASTASTGSAPRSGGPSVAGGGGGGGVPRAVAPPAVPSRRRPELPLVAPLAKYKLVFLGDQGVGKTSIIKSFVTGSYDNAYEATLGIDFLSKTMYLADRTVHLQLWDTAGQERFRSLIPSYIRDSSVAVVVYDITNRASFLNTERWIRDVKAEGREDVVIMLVGNKTDLSDDRKVAVEEGEEAASEGGIMFIETSAKEGYNVNPLFRRLATALPGMDAVVPAVESNLIDITLNPAPARSADSSAQGCGC